MSPSLVSEVPAAVLAARGAKKLFGCFAEFTLFIPQLAQDDKPRADSENLDRHRANFFFHFRGVHHRDRVPWTSVEEAAIGTLAEAFLAANAEDRIDSDAPEWRMIVVGNPEHAVFHRAIFNAGGRTGASRTAFGDDRELFGFFLAWGGEAFGLRFKLLLVRNHSDGFGRSGCGGHGWDYNPEIGRQAAGVGLQCGNERNAISGPTALNSVRGDQSKVALEPPSGRVRELSTGLFLL